CGPPGWGSRASIASGLDQRLELSIVMPCLNEAATVADCVKQARDALAKYGINGEVIVADNGSTDGSRELATAAGARGVAVPLLPGRRSCSQAGSWVSGCFRASALSVRSDSTSTRSYTHRLR